MRLLAVVSVCFALLACTAPAHADPPPLDPSTVPAVLPIPAPIVIATYEGHTARWWAQRARRNGTRMRHLQHALRSSIDTGSSFARARALTSAFICIHGYEAGWYGDNNPTYDGGLQMDSQFQSRYGGEFARAWGSADHWPAFVQVTVAMRAYFSGRGFWPWPNTARYCGLL